MASDDAGMLESSDNDSDDCEVLSVSDEPSPIVQLRPPGYAWASDSELSAGKGKAYAYLFLKSRGGTLMLRRYTRASLDSIVGPTSKRQKQNALDFRRAWCAECQVQVAGNCNESLSNFIKHCNCKHGQQLKPIHSNQMSLSCSVGNCDHVSGACHCTGWTRADSALADQLLAVFLCNSASPVSLVDSPYMRAWVGLVSGHNYTPPGRTKMRDIITELGARVRTRVQKQLRNATGVSFTSDGWSANHKTFYAITATYLDEQYKMQCVVVDIHQFEQSHDSGTMSTMLLDTLNRIGVDHASIVSLVGDAAAAQQLGMKKAWARIDPNLTQRVWCRCLAHMLQTCIRTALEDVDPWLNQVRDIIANVKTVCAVFGRSSIAHEALAAEVRKEQDAARRDENEAEMIQFRAYAVLSDCTTRWDGTLMLLKRFVRLKRPIKSALMTLSDKKVGNAAEGVEAMQRLTDLDVEARITDLIMLLGNLRMITKAAQMTSVMSGSVYYIAWIRLLAMQLDDNADSHVRRLLERIQKEVVRLEPGLDNSEAPLLEPALIALYLTPCMSSYWRQLKKRRPLALEEAKSALIKTARHTLKDKDSTNSSSTMDTESPSHVREQGIVRPLQKDPISALAFHPSYLDEDDDDTESITALTPEERLRRQMQEYEATWSLARDKEQPMDTSLFWRVQQTKWPELACMAKHSLAYTCSSADSERVFSLTGRLMTKRRAKMSLDLLRDSLTISGNKADATAEIDAMLTDMGKMKT